MKRGDIVIVSLPGDYGKPRPAVVCRMTGWKGDWKVTSSLLWRPSTKAQSCCASTLRRNGLKQASKVMVDKLYAIPEHRIHQHIGKLDRDSLRRIDLALMMMLDLDPLKQGYSPD
ncbi:type II toxin-antitoxin system PemK/MazF family toxin [Kumtagia ephedrae]|uniref:Growth inhibitor PemK n=1 Tax=Kumtagia ephedrae TaxID=2116701 RepID=A0A2P7SQS7_9HYPH|nr:type II toxin-antitoxin system PemK/MazF family toxin [Mesorhizobium ephedrae]PSJ64842.1 growth inhibitor PemK [Mesorhizobium ephedrae]